MLNELLKLANTLLAVFVTSGGAIALSKYLKGRASTEKNENIKRALEFSNQAVLVAQAFIGTGEVQQAAAAAEMKKRLDENNIGNNFTEAQILTYIKQAYAVNKANGTLDAVKPLVSDKDLSEAESAIAVTFETA